VAREAEVENFDSAVVSQEQVFWFEIPMDDPFLVRGAETARDLDRIIHRLTDRKRTICESGSQCLPREEFCYSVRDPVSGAGIEDRKDGWVGERRDSLRFTFEPGKRGRIVRQPPWEDLDGDVAVETSVSGAVDLTHASGANGSENFVGT
jgi:hypothetical protein